MVIIFAMPKSINKPSENILDEIRKRFTLDPISGLMRNGLTFNGTSRKEDQCCVVEVKGRLLYIHHIVWFLFHNNWPDTFIDHIDGNRNNNWPDNLRAATNIENSQNTRKTSKKTTSQYKGVSFNRGKIQKPWRTYIKQNGQSLYVGSYATEEEAARAYDAKAKELFGEFACPNFGDNNALDRLKKSS